MADCIRFDSISISVSRISIFFFFFRLPKKKPKIDPQPHPLSPPKLNQKTYASPIIRYVRHLFHFMRVFVHISSLLYPIYINMTENPVDKSFCIVWTDHNGRFIFKNWSFLDLYLGYLLPRRGFRAISLLSDSKLLIHESMSSRT